MDKFLLKVVRKRLAFSWFSLVFFSKSWLFPEKNLLQSFELTIDSSRACIYRQSRRNFLALAGMFSFGRDFSLVRVALLNLMTLMICHDWLELTSGIESRRVHIFC